LLGGWSKCWSFDYQADTDYVNGDFHNVSWKRSWSNTHSGWVSAIMNPRHGFRRGALLPLLYYVFVLWTATSLWIHVVMMKSNDCEIWEYSLCKRFYSIRFFIRPILFSLCMYNMSLFQFLTLKLNKDFSENVKFRGRFSRCWETRTCSLCGFQKAHFLR